MNKCKWCGGNDVSLWVVEREGSLIAYYLRCNNCGMKTKKYRDKAFAIDEWNNIQMKEDVALRLIDGTHAHQKKEVGGRNETSKVF